MHQTLNWTRQLAYCPKADFNRYSPRDVVLAMSSQHGTTKIARKVAALGVAFWAADDVRMSNLIAEVFGNPAEASQCVSSSKVRE